MVMASGTSAVVVQGLKLISVDLSQQDHQTKTVSMEEGIVTGMMESDTGRLILVRKKPDGNTAIESREAVTLQLLRQANSPVPLSGAMITWQGPANEWLGFADDLGSIRYINLDSIALDNRPTNLFVDEGASDLLLSNDKKTLYSALPRHGRVTASSTADRSIQWSVQIDGEPTRLGMNSEGKLIAVDPKQNRVTLIDPLTQSALGERQIGLGLGSTLNPRWGARIIDDKAYALARESMAIGVMDTNTFERTLGAALLRTPIAFALAPDASSAVVVHEDGTIGFTKFDRKVFQIEKIVCGSGPVGCDPLSAPLVALEYVDTDRVLVVTTDSSRIVRLPAMTIESQKTALAGTRFVGAKVTTNTVGLATAVGSPATQLMFDEYALSTGFQGSPQKHQVEEAFPMDSLTFLGLDAYRRSDMALAGAEQTGLAFFFSHLIEAHKRTRIDVLDRSDPQLTPAGFTGIFPTFSPDGRQVLGLGIGAASGQLIISEGDPLSTSGITPRVSIDFGSSLTGVGYEADGHRAFVVNGDRDQLFLLE
jgi:hypothetical protein